MRRPLRVLAALDRRRARCVHGGATEIGDRRLKPDHRVEHQRRVLGGARQRAVHLAGIPGSGIGSFGIRPGVGRMPTMPQNAAGMRIEQPKSVPCASGTMPVATATAEPPDEPAGLSVGIPGIARGAEHAR